MRPSPPRRAAVRAIDTNVLIRFLTADDPAQAAKARAIFAAGDLFIGVTVLLEAEWVLRAAYGFAPGAVADGLRRVAGLPGVAIEDAGAVAEALAAMDGGMDFADALHLARAGRCEAFLTFDQRLAKRGGERVVLAG